MKNLKFLIVSVLCALIVLPIFAQERTETTVEEEYLSTVEDIIITELSAAPDRESKAIALDYLQAAIEGGRTSPEMTTALRSLAGEGVFKESRTNGRKVNNFPEIRARACTLLGEVGDDYARKTLTDVILADNEPSVTAAAVKALGNISADNADDAVETIAWTEKQFAIKNPTSSLAFEVLNAYEKLGSSVQDNSAMIRSISQIAANQYYTRSVRDKALSLLKSLNGM